MTSDAHPVVGHSRHDRVTDLVSEVAALATRLGATALARRLEQEADRAGAAPARVVVAGEKNRGKSSLINALVGRDGLLPVAADVATSCYLELRHGPTTRVTVYDGEHPDGAEIREDQLAEYAAVDPVEGRERHPDVTAVELTLDHPLLARGLVLVDTPGVGGLDAGHTEVTLAALRQADALVLVMDPDSPLTGPELRFLRQAAERIATVVLVLTKTDLYPGWRQILADNKALMARQAAAYAAAPWVPVSSLRLQDALRAAGRGNATRAAELRARSGFGELEALLADRVAGRAAALRRANLLSVTTTVLERLRADLRLRARSAAGDPALAEALRTEQAELAAFTQANTGWQRDLREAFRRLDTTMRLELTRRVTAVRRHYEQEATEADADMLERLPRDLDAALQGAWMEVSHQLRQEVGTLGLAQLRELGEAGDRLAVTDLAYPEQLTALPPVSRSPDPRGGQGPGRWMEDSMPVASAAGGVYFVLCRVLDAVAPGVGLAGGAGLGLLLRRYKRTNERRLHAQRDAQRYIGQVAQDAATEMLPAMQQELRVLEQQAETAILRWLTERRGQLDAAVKQHQERLQADQARRDHVRTGAQRELQQAETLLATARQLRGRTGDAADDDGGTTARSAAAMEGRS